MIKVLQLGGLFSAHADWALKGDNYCYLEYLGKMIELSRKGPVPAEVFNKPEYQRYGGPYKVPTSWYNTNDDPTDDLVLGMPMTTDVNGACSLPKPDKEKPDREEKENPIPLDYEKEGIGSLYHDLYNESVVDVSKVRFHKQVTGNRTFDVNKDGMAHYGLIPDYIKLRQIQDPDITFNAFFNGAEAYLRMLERVERYHADPDNYPSRDPAYWEEVNYEDWWGWYE
jgi:hypothetical protein